ncbi:integrase arm-type DNA-binding domain-containing protein [Moraxella sp. VT-16-12]|uniref:tyrosine-type recombinase/integrase n=1 Tax=Moraxella sp. VT-16-12 TaxID=2014877 RepID=UPI000B7E550D|nr:integrase arm-type DNA-binding domain-containing protein [Moraxella sp. VT-16-12]TWV81547.1 tyrosine-type recombinase/integrase [Moraxella sp. VT-16-12]
MARQTKPLSSTQIDKAKPKDKLYRLYDGNGLVINITPNGGKYWYLQYKHPITTKSQMYKLGDYPVLSLADARIACQDCRKLLAQNIDPKTYFELERQKQENALKNDFKSVFREWLETKNYSPKTQEKMQNYQDELLAVIGNKAVSDITVPDLMLVLKPIEKAGHFAKLEKVRSLINQTLTYAVATGRSDTNPAINLKGAFKMGEIRHNPAILDEKRLGDLVCAMDGYHGYFVTRQALMFLLLMFARPGEIRYMTWEQVDLDNGTWTYMPNKTKKSTSVQMVSPLSHQAIEILRQMKEYRPYSELVFPSAITQARPLSENTLNQALRRMGFDSSEQTSHGFRAIARTLLEEKFKYDYRMIEMQLGHQVRDSNGRAYNRVQWLDERREMLQVWADYIYQLKTPTP